jgi:hypothetical protein
MDLNCAACRPADAAAYHERITAGKAARRSIGP